MGTAGDSGTGTAGAGGAPGTAGDNGAAGTSGTAGSGVVTGTAGASPDPGGGYGGKYPGTVTGAISCDVAGGGAPSPLAAMLALAAVLVGRARPSRRRRNRHQQDLDSQEVGR
jgi:hypothetical protein